MGRGGSGHFNGTKGSQNTIYSGGNKKDALGSVSSMPKEIQNSVKNSLKEVQIIIIVIVLLAKIRMVPILLR